MSGSEDSADARRLRRIELERAETAKQTATALGDIAKILKAQKAAADRRRDDDTLNERADERRSDRALDDVWHDGGAGDFSAPDHSRSGKPAAHAVL
jgi:hypothetical protein